MDIRPLNKQTQPARLHRRLGGLALLLVLALTFVHSTGAGAQTFTGFTVDSTDDEADREVGDGKCDTRLVTRKCTLRAAIQESNALGGRAIRVPPGTYTIELASELRFTAPSSITPTTSGRVLVQSEPGRAGSLFRVQPPTGSSVDVHVTFTRVDLRRGVATGAGNTSDCGGALRVQGRATTEFVDSTIANSFTNTSGGGVCIVNSTPSPNKHSLHLVRSTVSGNRCEITGGGIHLDGGTVKMENATISDNECPFGGGINVKAGSIEAFDTLIQGNRADAAGAGMQIIAGANVTFRQSFFNDNQFNDNAQQTNGGAISNAGTLLLKNVTLQANRGRRGGAITNSGALRAINVTIVGNSKDGGAVLNTGDLKAFNVTANGNQLVVSNEGNQADVRNQGTALVANSVMGACLGTFQSGDFNLISFANGCTLPGSNNIVAGTAGLGFVNGTMANGFPVFLPSPTNPGVDKGNPGPTTGHDLAPISDSLQCETVDQRGKSRPKPGSQNGVARCDIGAVEIEINIEAVGVLALSPEVSDTSVGANSTLSLTWTVPDPMVWRDLESVTATLRRGDDIVGAIRFDEASGAVMVAGPDGVFGAGSAPGSAGELVTPVFALDLAATTVTGSGPTGKEVAMQLALRFTDPGIYRVSVAARADDGREEESDATAHVLVQLPFVEE